jgi:hypothetical protein
VYYVEAYDINTNCVSSTRTAVTAYVNANPAAPASITVSDKCDNETLTFTVAAGQPTSYTYDWTIVSPASAIGETVGRTAYQFTKDNGNGPNTYTVKVKSAVTYRQTSGRLGVPPEFDMVAVNRCCRQYYLRGSRSRSALLFADRSRLRRYGIDYCLYFCP